MSKKTLLLSPDLQDVLARVGSQLESGGRIEHEVNRLLDLLNDLPPELIAHADSAIANAAGLYRRDYRPLRMFYHPSDQKDLVKTPELAYLFIFHRDGRLREVALRHLSGSLPSPFLFAAIAWRLNDWAPPVRKAALACAARCFPQTSPLVIARSARALLIRRLSWGRWTDERASLDETFCRSDVAGSLADLLIHEKNGPLASVLRAALRLPGLDGHLWQIAQRAIQPSVRRVALETLIDGQAEWPSGYGWKWEDKSMGLRRRVVVHERRALAVEIDRSSLISTGIQDRSVIVRRAALAGILQHLRGTREARNHAASLLSDRSPSIRERAQFILNDQVA